MAARRSNTVSSVGAAWGTGDSTVFEQAMPGTPSTFAHVLPGQMPASTSPHRPWPPWQGAGRSAAGRRATADGRARQAEPTRGRRRRRSGRAHAAVLLLAFEAGHRAGPIPAVAEIAPTLHRCACCAGLAPGRGAASRLLFGLSGSHWGNLGRGPSSPRGRVSPPGAARRRKPLRFDPVRVAPRPASAGRRRCPARAATRSACAAMAASSPARAARPGRRRWFAAGQDGPVTSSSSAGLRARSGARRAMFSGLELVRLLMRG